MFFKNHGLFCLRYITSSSIFWGGFVERFWRFFFQALYFFFLMSAVDCFFLEKPLIFFFHFSSNFVVQCSSSSSVFLQLFCFLDFQPTTCILYKVIFLQVQLENCVFHCCENEADVFSVWKISTFWNYYFKSSRILCKFPLQSRFIVCTSR